MNVLIAEDHALVRDALELLITAQQARLPINIVARANDGHEAVSLHKAEPADLILMDIAMPNMDGIEATRAIRAFDDAVKVVMLTAKNDHAEMQRAQAVGADGYLLKSSNSDLMVETLVAVVSGFDGFVNLNPELAPIEEVDNPFAALTRREHQVMTLLLEGHPNRAMAELLEISVRTVEKHRANACHKLGTTSLAEIRALARQSGQVL